MLKKYPYLKDIDFLNKIYGQHNRSVYVNITVLDWAERPLQEVQSKVISASMSVNGDSSVRRTANLSIKILDNSELYTNIDSLFSINKKIYLETGLSNGFAHLGEEYYSSYPIIWFPFGVMIIEGCSVNHDISGITVNLSLGDKMCLLNGEAGGTIPASTNFESVDTIGSDGDLHSEWLPINRIIPEMVHHFGGEDINNIIVIDIPDRITQVMKWCGTNPLNIMESLDVDYETGQHQAYFTTINADYDEEKWSKRVILNGYDAGCIYTDFTYPGELGAGAGDTVCTVLDKIKNTLGNYEYYYDVFGRFIFQEIKNYVNTSEWKTLYQETYTRSDGEQTSEKDGSSIYLPYTYNPRLTDIYNLDTDFVISCSNSPQFNMIKNDFIVWGARKTEAGQTLPCRYHLAIEKRPDITEDYLVDANICFDIDMVDKVKKCHIVDIVRENEKGQAEGSGVVIRTLKALKYLYPTGEVGKYYAVFENGGQTSIDPETQKEFILYNTPSVYTWVTDVAAYQRMLAEYSKQMQDGVVPETEIEEASTAEAEAVAGYVKLPYATYYTSRNVSKWCDQKQFVIPAGGDWRDRLYFYGLVESRNGTEANYYFSELVTEWPKVYDVENHCYYKEVMDAPTSLDYWLDLVDNDAILNEFSVDNIGRRSYAKTESGCNCVFEPDVPEYILVDTTDPDAIIDARTGMTLEDAIEMGLTIVNIDPAIYNSMITGGTYNSCYENVRQIIQDYTDYNNSVSITCLPIYHLEPNTRIYINDPDSGVQGNYLINSISYSLGNNGTMSISAKKINEKI